MEVKCEYCGALIPDDSDKCPNCGAVNKNMRRGAEGIPKTIEELKNWYQEHDLPPYEVTRFFIGIDCKEPKAFGIYKEDNRFIVYKNKADGSRAIRYEGRDEDYAVNELYTKLKSEILNQREHLIEDDDPAPCSEEEPEQNEWPEQSVSDAAEEYREYEQKKNKKRHLSENKTQNIIVICIVAAVCIMLFLIGFSTYQKCRKTAAIPLSSVTQTEQQTQEAETQVSETQAAEAYIAETQPAETYVIQTQPAETYFQPQETEPAEETAAAAQSDNADLYYYIPYLYSDGTTWWDDEEEYYPDYSYSSNDNDTSSIWDVWDSSWDYDYDYDYDYSYDTWDYGWDSGYSYDTWDYSWDSDWDYDYSWDTGSDWSSDWSDWDYDW